MTIEFHGISEIVMVAICWGELIVPDNFSRHLYVKPKLRPEWKPLILAPGFRPALLSMKIGPESKNYISLLKEAVGQTFSRIPLREIERLDHTAPVFHQNTSQVVLLRKEKCSVGGKLLDIRRVFARPQGVKNDSYSNVGWVLDADVDKCMVCMEGFGWFTWKHHCRCCGDIVCSDCCEATVILSEYPEFGYVHVCNHCYYGQETLSIRVLFDSSSEGLSHAFNEEGNSATPIGEETQPDTHQTEPSTTTSTTKAAGNQTNIEYPNGDIYTGEVIDGNVKHGRGVLVSADGSRYEGNFENDLKSGHGVQDSENGCHYEGNFENDLCHGRGVMILPDGSVYDGEYDQGVVHGFGRFEADGDVYEGEWQQHLQCGQGKLTYANGDVYTGSYADDMRNGFGKFEYANGDVYEGEFCNDLKHGKGIYTAADGDVYEGEFENDVKSGPGRLVSIIGDVYEGQFANNMKHGKGKMVYEDGSSYEGDHEEDMAHGKGLYIGVDGSTYDGAWVYNTQTGYGVLKFENGDHYEGEFLDDARHGVGRWTYTIDGHTYVYKGGFEDDEMHGRGTLTDDAGELTHGFWEYGVFVETVEEKAAREARGMRRASSSADYLEVFASDDNKYEVFKDNKLQNPLVTQDASENIVAEEEPKIEKTEDGTSRDYFDAFDDDQKKYAVFENNNLVNPMVLKDEEVAPESTNPLAKKDSNVNSGDNMEENEDDNNEEDQNQKDETQQDSSSNSGKKKKKKNKKKKSFSQ